MKIFGIVFLLLPISNNYASPAAAAADSVFASRHSAADTVFAAEGAADYSGDSGARRSDFKPTLAAWVFMVWGAVGIYSGFAGESTISNLASALLGAVIFLWSFLSSFS